MKSTSPISLKDKLRKIQNLVKVPKGQLNKFSNFYYRSCEDILESLKPILFDNEVILVLTDQIVHVSGRFYVEATARLIDIGSDQNIEIRAYAREQEEKRGMDGSQITGSSSSYARKYALNGLFLIDDTKDADTMDNKVSNVKKVENQDVDHALRSRVEEVRVQIGEVTTLDDLYDLKDTMNKAKKVLSPEDYGKLNAVYLAKQSELQ